MGGEQWVYGVTVCARTWHVIATRESPTGEQDPASLLGWYIFPIVQFFARNDQVVNTTRTVTPIVTYQRKAKRRLSGLVISKKFGHVLR